MRITIIALLVLAVFIFFARIPEPRNSTMQFSDAMKLPIEQQNVFFDQYFFDHYWSYHGFRLSHTKAGGWWASIHGFNFPVMPVAAASVLAVLALCVFRRDLQGK